MPIITMVNSRSLFGICGHQTLCFHLTDKNKILPFSSVIVEQRLEGAKLDG
jgi:hypothetical protein